MSLPFPVTDSPLLGDSAQGAEEVFDAEVFGRVVDRKVKRGINLTGGSDYDAFWSLPTTAEIRWAKRQGFEIVRIPYRWERLQPTLGAAFNATHQTALDNAVREVVAQGMIAQPVTHNFGGRVVVGGTGAIGAPEVKIGSATLTHAHWEDFCSRLGALWADISDSVWLDLMNEPDSLPLNGYATETDHLVAIYNKAIVQLRTAGFTGRIVLEGNGYNNAQFFDDNPWYNTGSTPPTSADAFHAGIVDSGNNWIASVHNYPEPDHGNSTDPITDPVALRTRMENVLAWCTSTGRSVIVGEYAANASDQYGEKTVRDFIQLAIENADKIEALVWWEARDSSETGDAYNIAPDVVPVDERVAWFRDLDEQVQADAPATVPEAVFGADLVALYEDGYAGGVWTDVTGSNNATARASSPPSVSTTPAGNLSLVFNGIDTGVYVSDVTYLDGLSDFTIGVAFKGAPTQDPYAQLISKLYGGVALHFGANSTGTALWAETNTIGTDPAATASNPYDNTWHRAIWVYAAGVGTLYLDGVAQADTQVAGSAVGDVAELLAFGACTTDGVTPWDYHFDGELSSPFIATRNATLGEVATLDAYLDARVGAAAPTGYTLTADAGTFAETGASAGLLVGRTVVAAAGTFAETGAAANLLRGYPLTASSGTFVETGATAGLLADRTVVAAAGSFAETGAAAGLLAGRLVAGNAGSFALTGADVTLTRVGSYSIAADAGGFSLTGASAGVTATRLLTASPGTFAETGTAAGLLVGRVVIATAGAYTETGTAVSLLAGRSVAAASGTFAETGAAAGLLATRTIAGDSGAFSLTGADATLTKVGASAIAADAGAFSLVGASAGLVVARTLGAAAASFASTGTAAGLLVGRVLTASSGAVSHTGSAVGLLATRTVTASGGTFTETGAPVTFVSGRGFIADAGAFSLTGSDAALRYTQQASAGAFALTGANASLLVGRAVSAASGSYVETGAPVVAALARRIVADSSPYSLLGEDAALRFARFVSAEAVSFALDGTAAGLTRIRLLLAEAGAYSVVGSVVDFTSSARPIVVDPGAFAVVAGTVHMFHNTVIIPIPAAASIIPVVNAAVVTPTSVDATLTAINVRGEME